MANNQIIIMQGNITNAPYHAQAIVNTANNALNAGGGVNGAIHHAAGPMLLQECKRLNGCETGNAKMTAAYKLPCKYVIHTVGPRWEGGNHGEEELLAACYENCLKLAVEKGITRLAFPSIGTGAHAFPVERAAEVAIGTVSKYFSAHPNSSQMSVIFVLADDKTRIVYENTLDKMKVIHHADQVHVTSSSSKIDVLYKHSMICFRHENEDNGYLSNWYPAEFDYCGIRFVNAEQFMMYHKVMMFHQEELAKRIMSTSDPAVAKQLGAIHFPEFDPVIWDKNCRTILKRGVRAKFRQNPQLLKKLLATGNALLVKCSLCDKRWGIGIDIQEPRRFDVSKWTGSNWLGIILMEVREELNRELQLNMLDKLASLDARKEAPITEWSMKVGELIRIPQYYQAIHAYSDTLRTPQERNVFYERSFSYWESAMETRMSGEFPVIGFYEMKQEIYEISGRLRGDNVVRMKHLTYCEKYIPVLSMIASDPELRQWCAKYSVYEPVQQHKSLEHYLMNELMQEAYNIGMVIPEYRDILENSALRDIVAEPTLPVLKQSSVNEILACIAWHFRRDHFVEGALIRESIGKRHLVRLLKAYREKLKEE